MDRDLIDVFTQEFSRWVGYPFLMAEKVLVRLVVLTFFLLSLGIAIGLILVIFVLSWWIRWLVLEGPRLVGQICTRTTSTEGRFTSNECPNATRSQSTQATPVLSSDTPTPNVANPAWFTGMGGPSYERALLNLVRRARQGLPLLTRYRTHVYSIHHPESSLGISVDTRGDIRVSSSNNDGAMASESATIPIPSPYSPQANEKPRENRDAPLSRPTVQVKTGGGVEEGSDTTKQATETRVNRRNVSEPTILPTITSPSSEETDRSTTTNMNAGKGKEKEKQPTSESSSSSSGTPSLSSSPVSVSPVVDVGDSPTALASLVSTTGVIACTTTTATGSSSLPASQCLGACQSECPETVLSATLVTHAIEGMPGSSSSGPSEGHKKTLPPLQTALNSFSVPCNRSTALSASTTPHRACLNENGKRKEPVGGFSLFKDQDLDQDESTSTSCSMLVDVPGPSSTPTNIPALSTGINPQVILRVDRGSKDQEECVGKGKEPERGAGVSFSPQSSVRTFLFGSTDSMIQQDAAGSTGPSVPCPTWASGSGTQKGSGAQGLEVRDKGKGKQRESTARSGDAEKAGQSGGSGGSASFPPQLSLSVTQSPFLQTSTNPNTSSTLFASKSSAITSLSAGTRTANQNVNVTSNPVRDTISAAFPSVASSSPDPHTITLPLTTSNVTNPLIFGQNKAISSQASNSAGAQPVTTGSSILPHWETFEREGRVFSRYQAISSMRYYRGTSFEVSLSNRRFFLSLHRFYCRNFAFRIISRIARLPVRDPLEVSLVRSKMQIQAHPSSVLSKIRPRAHLGPL
ncbi:hypothetical protein PM082_023923 [Marasmius tenuissimus]|nr:hypothetical protein PM082_023923 [Marasmius tenuissimus]